MPSDSVEWLLERASRESAAVFVAAHGAGSHRDHRSMLELSAVLREQGFDVVRFNFLYREKGARAPDRMPQLQACFRAVADQVRDEVGNRKLLIGGRSMGARVASMLAAEGFACDGLLLFAYPLHPAGRPERLRAAHLPNIRVPVLCFNGTRDALCDRDLMERALKGLSWQMHWLEGADHSFHVLKSSGRSDAEILEEVRDVSAEWVLAN
jgi:predicted alpha/beta-hydrolase family hydrolase